MVIPHSTEMNTVFPRYEDPRVSPKDLKWLCAVSITWSLLSLQQLLFLLFALTSWTLASALVCCDDERWGKGCTWRILVSSLGASWFSYIVSGSRPLAAYYFVHKNKATGQNLFLTDSSPGSHGCCYQFPLYTLIHRLGRIHLGLLLVCGNLRIYTQLLTWEMSTTQLQLYAPESLRMDSATPWETIQITDHCSGKYKGHVTHLHYS